MKEKAWMQTFRESDLDHHHDLVRFSAPRVDSSPARYRAQPNTRQDYERSILEKKINRENRLLVLKLAGTSHITDIDYSAPHLGPGGRRNPANIRKKKKQEVENQKMLKRILTAENTLSVKKWNEDEKKRQKLLQYMARFPAKPVTVLSNISGAGWKEANSGRASRPVTAYTRREKAWNSNTTDVNIQDSNDLLGVKYETPIPARKRTLRRRPKTADSLHRKVVSDTGGSEARQRKGSAKIERRKGGGEEYGISLGRNRPGYSNDPADRDFDDEYRELFATAREEYFQVAKGRKSFNAFTPT